MSIKKAVFPVGGWGTRFLPATKAIPKAMFPIVDKPIVHYVVEEAVRSGIDQIIFINTPNNRAIEDYFSRSSELEELLEKTNKDDLLMQVQEIPSLASFFFSADSPRIRDSMRGLGVAILNARSLVGNEPFAVLLPNDLIDAETPCMKSLIALFQALESPLLAVKHVSDAEIATYGNVAYSSLDEENQECLMRNPGPYDPSRVYEIKKLIQKPVRTKKLSNKAIIGRYILPSTVFEVLDQIEPGYEGQVQLTDALEMLRKRGIRMFAYEFDGHYHDTRSRLGYVKANVSYALKLPNTAGHIRDFLGNIADLKK